MEAELHCDLSSAVMLSWWGWGSMAARHLLTLQNAPVNHTLGNFAMLSTLPWHSSPSLPCSCCACAGLEIVLTLGAAYGCYFVAEDLAGASGLLAVVVMGFSMSLLGEHHAQLRGGVHVVMQQCEGVGTRHKFHHVLMHRCWPFLS